MSPVTQRLALIYQETMFKIPLPVMFSTLYKLRNWGMH